MTDYLQWIKTLDPIQDYYKYFIDYSLWENKFPIMIILKQLLLTASVRKLEFVIAFSFCSINLYILREILCNSQVKNHNTILHFSETLFSLSKDLIFNEQTSYVQILSPKDSSSGND